MRTSGTGSSGGAASIPPSSPPARRSPERREAWRASDRRPAILVMAPLHGQHGLGLIAPLGSVLHALGIACRFVVAEFAVRVGVLLQNRDHRRAMGEASRAYALERP
jgi:hypothetical protein